MQELSLFCARSSKHHRTKIADKRDLDTFRISNTSCNPSALVLFSDINKQQIRSTRALEPHHVLSRLICCAHQDLAVRCPVVATDGLLQGVSQSSLIPQFCRVCISCHGVDDPVLWKNEALQHCTRGAIGMAGQLVAACTALVASEAIMYS